MRRATPPSTVILCLVPVLASFPCVASAGLSLTPFMGYVAPTNSMTVAATAHVIMEVPGMPMFGARLGWDAGTRLVPELSVAYGRGDVAVIGTGELATSTSQLQADARVRVGVCHSGPVDYSLILGVGAQHLGSAVFDYFKDQGAGIELKTRPAGIVGLGARVRLGEALRARIDFEDRIHRTELESDATANFPDKNTEHDLMMSIGLALPLGGR